MKEKNIEKKDIIENFTDVDKRHNEQASFTRLLNQLLALYDFWRTTGPYAPYSKFAKDKKPHLKQDDTTFTWIDLKTANPRKIYKMMEKFTATGEGDEISAKISFASLKKYLTVLCNKCNISADMSNINMISSAIKKIIAPGHVTQTEKTNNEIINTLIEKNIATKSDCLSKEEKIILTKLYHISTPLQQDKYFNKEEEKEKNYISLNESGCKHFTNIMYDLFVYAKQHHYPGKNREDYLFINGDKEYIRKKLLVDKVTLTEKNLVELLVYLLRDFKNNEIKGIKGGYNLTIDTIETIKDKTKLMKKLFVNLAYEAIFNEQLFDYYTIKEVFKDRALHDTKGGIYTERSIKDLGSLANKGIRKQPVYDLVRSRSRMPDNLLTSDKQDKYCAENIVSSIGEFIDHINSQGYEIEITNIELVSKYPKKPTKQTSSGEENEKQQSTIYFSDKSLQNIQNTYLENLQDRYTNNLKLQKSNEKGDINNQTNAYQKNISGLSYLSNIEEKQIIMKTFPALFTNDQRKGGANPGYTDLKIKMAYRIRKKGGGKWIENPGGYEHMITHYSSTNEAGLSNHNLILNAKKTINHMCKTNSTIGFDVVGEQITGGLNKHIMEMKDWEEKGHVSPDQWDPNLEPQELIKKQFEIRNKIPKEWNENHRNITLYTGLDGHPVSKSTIERNIVAYLLKTMIKDQTLCWYIYDVDKKQIAGDVGTEMSYALTSGNKHCYVMNKNASKQFMDNAFNAPPEKMKYYRLCGGGNGNLKNMLEKGTSHLNAYIGCMTDTEEIVRMKVPRMMGIYADTTDV